MKRLKLLDDEKAEESSDSSEEESGDVMRDEYA
jgi:hypothetical protein